MSNIRLIRITYTSEDRQKPFNVLIPISDTNRSVTSCVHQNCQIPKARLNDNKTFQLRLLPRDKIKAYNRTLATRRQLNPFSEVVKGYISK